MLGYTHAASLAQIKAAIRTYHCSHSSRKLVYYSFKLEKKLYQPLLNHRLFIT